MFKRIKRKTSKKLFLEHAQNELDAGDDKKCYTVLFAQLKNLLI